MITIHIPGRKAIKARHLVLDYNGTLAVDGKLSEETKNLLSCFEGKLEVHVLTADTFGSAEQELSGTGCRLIIIKPSKQVKHKGKYIKKLGANNVVAIGNGRNDVLMLKKAALGICVILHEGASVEAISSADIVCTSIDDALSLLLNPLRIIATLRK